MHYHSEINEKFPIRKKGEQKDLFLRYAVSEAQKMGYSARVEDIKNNRNLIVGDPESAKAVFTAHYDTPAVMPFPNFITPRNILFYVLYQLLPVGCIILSAHWPCCCAGRFWGSRSSISSMQSSWPAISAACC